MLMSKSVAVLLLVLGLIVPTLIPPSASPTPEAAPPHLEWTDIRFTELGQVELPGQWIGENEAQIRSETINSDGHLVMEFDRLDRQIFVVLPADAEAIFASGRATSRNIPSCCRLAMRVSPLGKVTATNDYRELESLVSSGGEGCALGRSTRGATAAELQAGVTSPSETVTEAVFVTSLADLSSYSAASGTLTLLRDRAIFGVPEDARGDYGLLMARRADGDLYLWLVPR